MNFLRDLFPKLTFRWFKDPRESHKRSLDDDAAASGSLQSKKRRISSTEEDLWNLGISHAMDDDWTESPFQVLTLSNTGRYSINAWEHNGRENAHPSSCTNINHEKARGSTKNPVMQRSQQKKGNPSSCQQVNYGPVIMGDHSRPLPRDPCPQNLPFKVMDPPNLVTSTPRLVTPASLLVFSNKPLVHSPPQTLRQDSEPEVEVVAVVKSPGKKPDYGNLKSSNGVIANGGAPSRVRHRLLSSSNMSGCSNSSRRPNTLSCEKKLKDDSLYSDILERIQISPPGLGGSRRQGNNSGSRTALENGDVQCVEDARIPLPLNSVTLALDSQARRQSCHRTSTSNAVNTMSPSNRLNIFVDRKRETQASTSALRRQQQDDDDCCVVGYLPALQQKQPSSATPDFLADIEKRYAEKYKVTKKQVEDASRDSGQLSAITEQAHLLHKKKKEEELHDRFRQYMRITEQFTPDEDVQEIPVLPDLTPDMEKEIDEALRQYENKVVVDAFSITIKGRDIRTLKGLNWLNDEVINFYMNLIIERGKADNYPSVYAFNTFFYPKLIASGHSSLKRWTRKVDVFAHEFLLVPVHLGMHWCMAIIEVHNKAIRYYDSMSGKNHQCLDALLKYLQDESLDKKKQVFDTSDWKTEFAQDIPQQNNGSDCGVFSCMYAEFVSRKAPINFTQDDMPYFRRKMVYEILRTKLLT